MTVMTSNEGYSVLGASQIGTNREGSTASTRGSKPRGPLAAGYKINGVPKRLPVVY